MLKLPNSVDIADHNKVLPHKVVEDLLMQRHQLLIWNAPIDEREPVVKVLTQILEGKFV